MKKELIIFLLLTFLAVILSIDYQPQIIEEKPDAYAVIKYMDDDINKYPNDINTFYLLFDKFKLDSQNFVSVLSFFSNYDYRIIAIYPYVNPLHQTTLKNISSINYKYNSLKDGIAGIYGKYLKELEQYRLSEEIDKVYVNGIRIRMMAIEVNNDVLYKFINNYNNIKYSLTPYGLFR